MKLCSSSSEIELRAEYDLAAGRPKKARDNGQVIQL
jgi:hypothetical protein